jgi:hypothetical protein
LIWANAEVVNQFLKHGRTVMRQDHPVPVGK